MRFTSKLHKLWNSNEFKLTKFKVFLKHLKLIIYNFIGTKFNKFNDYISLQFMRFQAD